MPYKIGRVMFTSMTIDDHERFWFATLRESWHRPRHFIDRCLHLPPPATLKQVLYVVRSPQRHAGFLETLVYSDRGGLQCPEPLLPMGQQTLSPTAGGVGSPSTPSGSSAAGWVGGRPYVNPHLVLRPSERVVDVKFQPLTNVSERTTWGYKVRGRC